MKWPEEYINQIICGDCLEVMKGMPSDCIDTIITDPPYNLSTIKRFKAKDSGEKWNVKSGVFHRTSKGFMGKEWDNEIAFQVETWEAVYRTAKPGATLLCFGGTRTYHRLACAIEDAGWVLKDCIMWLYGSGFPKATDISKNLDKMASEKREVIGKYELPDVADGKRKKGWECTNTTDVGVFGVSGQQDITAPATPEATLWNGWKSHGLKPAYEPILVAMKPNEGSYANNALKWGVAGLNIDGGRIRTDEIKKANSIQSNKGIWHNAEGGVPRHNGNGTSNLKGRYPANVILECTCDEVIEGGEIKNGSYRPSGRRGGHRIKGSATKFNNGLIRSGDILGHKDKALIHTDPNCPCYMLDEQGGISKSRASDYNKEKGADSMFMGNKSFKSGIHFGDKGGASRFFYCAKASKTERNRGCEGLEEKERANINKMMGEAGNFKTGSGGDRTEKFRNNHPTVKPLALMKYLCTLTETPTGGIVLDPFCGSGTTLMACKELKRGYIGIDNIPEYCEIARRRINTVSETLF